MISSIRLRQGERHTSGHYLAGDAFLQLVAAGATRLCWRWPFQAVLQVGDRGPMTDGFIEAGQMADSTSS